MFIGKLSVCMGLTGRGDNGANVPWMGFNYGSWIPKFRWNGGRYSRREVVDVGWYWLCLHGSFTYWGN